MPDHSMRTDDQKFELDPFISQLARWIDNEVTTERPECKALNIAERIVRICLELDESDVATKSRHKSIPVWVTARAIDSRIGGAKISHNARFKISGRANSAFLDQFQRAVKRHLKHRLTSMLEMEEALFRLRNIGKIRIVAIDPSSRYIWGVAGSKHRSRPGTHQNQ
jgi:hypothetical protein